MSGILIKNQRSKFLPCHVVCPDSEQKQKFDETIFTLYLCSGFCCFFFVFVPCLKSRPFSQVQCFFPFEVLVDVTGNSSRSWCLDSDQEKGGGTGESDHSHPWFHCTPISGYICVNSRVCVCACMCVCMCMPGLGQG